MTIDMAEKWLRENDPAFGKGEYPYLSARQERHRRNKETPVDPLIMDSIDFSVARDGNYGTCGHLSTIKKDRHKQGQKDTDLC